MGKKYVGQTPSDDKDIVTKKYVDDNIGGGSGDVVGPASSTDNTVPVFDGTSGKLLKNSYITATNVGSNTTLSTYAIETASLSVVDSMGITSVGSIETDDTVSATNGVLADSLNELTLNAGVTVDGLLVKGDTISSSSGATLGLSGGVAGNVSLRSNDVVLVLNDNFATNAISERTAASGVTIDSVLLKDGNVDGRDVSVDGTRLDAITDANYKNSNTTKAQVGLSNVDNTSDTSKPISTLTQTALDGKIGSTTTKKFTLSATAPSSPLDGDLWADKSSTGVSTLVKAVGEMLMPVGTIYSNKTDATNPGTKFGFGTWVPFNTGTVMVSKAPSGTFSAAGTTVGAETHVLTISEMPAHTHSSGRTSGTSGSFGLVDSNSASSSGTWNTLSTGGGLAHNNIQPSTVTYMWERTA